MAPGRDVRDLLLRSLRPGSPDLAVRLGGHEPGLLRKASGELQELLTTGLPLGVAPELPLGLAEVPFDPGDLLLLYTDGLVDAPGVGRERLAHCLQRGVTSSQAMVDRIFSLSHRLTEEPVDDVMVLVLRSQAPEEAEESLMDLVAELMPPGRVG